MDDSRASCLESLRSVLSLMNPPICSGAAADTFVSAVVRDGGFFASTVPRPDASPQAVIAQARYVATQTNRAQYIWTFGGSDLALACWQQSLPFGRSLAAMQLSTPGVPRDVGTTVVQVDDHETATQFRSVHLERFGDEPDPQLVVNHFASDRVLLDPAVTAVVALRNGVPIAAGYRHIASTAVSGIFWVATRNAHRRLGLGTSVVEALIHSPSVPRPVLHATQLGRPVYLRAGFTDIGLLDLWIVEP